MLLKYSLAWIPMVLLAILNGIFRQLFFVSAFGDKVANQVSVVTAFIIFLAYSMILFKKMPIENKRESWSVGLMWVSLSVIFEFAFGHYLVGDSWEKLLLDYHVWEGQFWPVLLLEIAFIPYLVFLFRRSRKTSGFRPLTRFGIGPVILVSAIAFSFFAGAINIVYGEKVKVQILPQSVLQILGIFLTIGGFVMLIFAGKAATEAFNSKKLETKGIFGRVRHPLYSAWIVFIIPGLALISMSWVALLTPFIAYFVFKLLIPIEEEFLEREFGNEYDVYKKSVPALIPIKTTRD